MARLARGPAAVGELAEPFDMALPSFLEHLRALERAGLVRSRKQGRVRTLRLVPGRLERARGRWTNNASCGRGASISSTTTSRP